MWQCFHTDETKRGTSTKVSGFTNSTKQNDAKLTSGGSSDTTAWRALTLTYIPASACWFCLIQAYKIDFLCSVAEMPRCFDIFKVTQF